MAEQTKAPGVWQLHEAKARFSEVFKRARTQGPQHVVKQGGEEVVIVPVEEFERLSRRAAQPERLTAFFRDAPTGEESLELYRRKDVTRDIDW